MSLQIEHLDKSFHGRPVLNDLSLTIEPGQIVGLLGPNGTGKSTLIKCVNGLLRPDAGMISLDGRSAGAPSAQLISYLPEKTYLNPSWSGDQAIRFFQDFYPDFDGGKARALMMKMNLDPSAEIRTMSKGMQEKLQTALVMARKVRLYILDEPIGGVDPASRDQILNLILENFEDDASMIISTHMIADIERILDRAVLMKDGRIIENEEAEAIRQREHSSLDEYFRKVYA